MKYHPYAEVWPLLEGEKFDKLVANIKANGLHYPIILYQEMIIDGRNRDRACAAAGVEPRYEVSKAKSDKEALMLSVTLNEHRRHMSFDQLAFVAQEIAKLTNGLQARRAHAISNEIASPILTLPEAATLSGVTLQHAQRARAIMNHAPELANDVKAGKMSMSTAANKAFEKSRAKKAAATKPRGQPPVAPKVVQLKHLTRQDVDPEFTGDDLAFAAEYGHVWMQTSEQRSTSYFADWATGMAHAARTLASQKLPKISYAAMNWLRRPKRQDVDRMKAAIVELEIALSQARTMLDKAEQALRDRAA